MGVNIIELGIIQIQSVELTKHIFVVVFAVIPFFLSVLDALAHYDWKLRPLF